MLNLPSSHLRLAELDEMLQNVNKEVEAFKKKELMTLDEMKNNVEKLDELTAILDAAVTELEVRGHRNVTIKSDSHMLLCTTYTHTMAIITLI